MDVGTLIREALEDLYQVYFDVNPNNDETYFVYRLDTEGDLYADDGPLMEETDVTLHLFTPITFDPTNLIRQVKRRLHKAGFSWPSSMSLSGGPGYARQASMPDVPDHRHIVFLCNHIDFIAGD